MNVDETNPGAIEVLLKVASAQAGLVNKLAISADEAFDLKDYCLYLMDSPQWGLAVDPLLLVATEEDKQTRAEGVLSVVVTQTLKGVRFLDLGCGEGHVPAEAAKQASLSVGYDPTPHQAWAEHPDNLTLTSDWSAVEANAPYDVVLLYDVLDHVVEEEPSRVLSRAKAVLAPGGKVYVQFHPWCSRHGTHLYQQINKAYVHMVFTEAQLLGMGYKPLPTVKVLQPLSTYPRWLERAGLQVVSGPAVVREPIEDFFLQPFLAGKIKSHWKNVADPGLSSGSQFPTQQTSVQFVGYVLA